jgi:murein DD-endopeptidase MepM/ murein hydrolase activator NlpD
LRLASPGRTGLAAAIALTAIGITNVTSAFAAATSPAPAPVASVQYRLPFEAGRAFAVAQGWHGSYSHSGTAAYAYDFALPSGTPVLAAAEGVVAFTHRGERACGGSELKDHGNSVTLYHADGTATLYAHLSRISVRVGQVVMSGDDIGRSGATGFTDCAPHLHFARQAQGRAVTQSEPIYFMETGHHRIESGASPTSQNPVCSQDAKDMPTDAFCAVYSNSTPIGRLRSARLEGTIGIMTVPATNAGLGPPVAATWIGRFTFADPAMYTFELAADYRVRLSIDGVVALDAWEAATGPGSHDLIRSLAAGAHVIRVDYQSGAVPLLQLTWARYSRDTATRPI